MRIQWFAKVVSFITVFLVISGCVAPRTLPDDPLPDAAKEAVITTVIHNPENDFGGCARPRQDCTETTILRASWITLSQLPPGHQEVDAAWCVYWKVRAQHPVLGEYQDLFGGTLVLQQGGVYRTSGTTYYGIIDGVIICDRKPKIE